MFVEDAVSPANGPFPIAFRIEGKTESRRRVKQMPLHATSRYPCRNATVHPSVVLRIRYGASYEIIDIGKARSGNIVCWIEVPSIVMNFTISAVKADAEPEVQSKARGNVKVILKVGLEDFVSVVSFD